GPYPRKALAMLAMMSFAEKDDRGAIALFRRFLSEHPRSPWSWVAAIRLGESLERLGGVRGAIAAYERTAAEPPDLAPAPVPGAGLAARAHEALGELTPALDGYRRALAGWDRTFGPTYVLDAPGALVDRATLQPTIQRLERLAKVENGPALARALRLLDRG